jgi:hypothetical protein
MADDDYYPPLVHRSRFRPDEAPFSLPDGLSVGQAPAELMGQPTDQTPFEMMNAAPVNPLGGDSVDSSTADVKAAYDREQDYKDSIFGKIAGMEIPQFGAEGSAINRVIDNANNPQLDGGGASVFGKMLGAVGIDGDGSRANTTWGQSLPNTATMLNPFAMASEGVKSASRWLGALKYPEKLETPDMLAPFGGAAMVAPFAPVHAVGSAGGKLRPRGAEAPSGANSPDSLPMDEGARLARADEQGWNPTTLYHATNQDFDAFDLDKAGSGINFGNPENAAFLTTSPKVADTYLTKRYLNDASTQSPGLIGSVENGVKTIYGEGDRVMPLRVRLGDDPDVYDHVGPYDPAFVKRAIDEARAAGKNAVVFNGMIDPGLSNLGQPKPSTVVAMLDPKNIRSKFAAFDPAKSGSSNLLAADQAKASIPGVIVQAAERAGADESPFSLPMDEGARLARAREGGFDTENETYRGLTAPYDSDIARQRPYQMFVRDPVVAGEFAGTEGPAPNVTPAYLRRGMALAVDAGGANWSGVPTAGLPEDVRGALGATASIDRIARRAKSLGYDTVEVKNVYDNQHGRMDKMSTVDVVFDPKNIRSKFAAFDPAKKDSPFLLAADQAKGSIPGVIVGAADRAEKGAVSDPKKPRVFYRGTNPGDERRISTGDKAWDGHLFASSRVDDARMYGSHITRVEAKPDAKILYEGSADFVKVAGRMRKGENLLTFSSRAAEAAKAAGYDAVHFTRQGDVGTAIINRDKFDVMDEAPQPKGDKSGPFELSADQAKASLPGVFAQAAERESQGPFSQAPKGVRAYHGSPHDFDRFDMSKIGTGEGAQAYGHGLYFAEAEDVAKEYRRRLSPDMPKAEPHLEAAARSFADFGSSEQDTIAGLRQAYKGANDDQINAAVMSVYGRKPGRMYEVNINADPEHFLDWDKPLSQQSEAVRGALAGFPQMNPAPVKYTQNGRWHTLRSGDAEWDLGEVKGGFQQHTNAGPLGPVYKTIDEAKAAIQNSGPMKDAYASTLMTRLGSGPYGGGEASQALREAGIPGIRYLDQGSRGAGEGSRNWVVFDDKIIEILKKYGIIAPPIGAGLFGATKGEDDEG